MIELRLSNLLAAAERVVVATVARLPAVICREDFYNIKVDQFGGS